ncbi:MAG: transcription elongation factor GreA [Anaerolineae bacterium]
MYREPMRLKAYQKLEKDLAYLKNVRLSEVAERLKEARSEGGDLSENIELGEAMREHAHVMAQIEQIEQRLSRAEIIDEDSPKSDVVALNSVVPVQEEGYDPETYQLVGSVEANPSAGMISVESPLGRALMGKKIGDRVEIEAPDGSFEMQIIGLE